jgi:hypothetical protein
MSNRKCAREQVKFRRDKEMCKRHCRRSGTCRRDKEMCKRYMQGNTKERSGNVQETRAGNKGT